MHILPHTGVINVTLGCLRQGSVRADESGSDEETTVTTRVYRRRVILKVCEAWCVDSSSAVTLCKCVKRSESQ